MYALSVYRLLLVLACMPSGEMLRYVVVLEHVCLLGIAAPFIIMCSSKALEQRAMLLDMNSFVFQGCFRTRNYARDPCRRLQVFLHNQHI